jgi:hypothetical protein
MRNVSLFLNILLSLTSCMLISCSDTSPEKIKEKALRIAENHAKDQLTEANKTVSKDGIIVLSDNETKCLIDPKFILTGDIDGDAKPDAVVSIFTFRDQKLALREHLILISKGGKLVIGKVLEGDMKFLSIKDKTIYIETSKIASDSPMYGCKICTEVNKYQFIDGDTVRMK